MTPEFLKVSEVLAIHALQIEKFGGPDGIEDLAAMASAYLFSIVKNHPFVDGNKRTDFIAALTFLGLNGCKTRFVILGVYAIFLFPLAL